MEQKYEKCVKPKMKRKLAQLYYIFLRYFPDRFKEKSTKIAKTCLGWFGNFSHFYIIRFFEHYDFIEEIIILVFDFDVYGASIVSIKPRWYAN